MRLIFLSFRKGSRLEVLRSSSVTTDCTALSYALYCHSPTLYNCQNHREFYIFWQFFFFPVLPSTGKGWIMCINWTDRVKYEDCLSQRQGRKEHPNTIKRTKTNRTSHILRLNCLLKHVIEDRTRRRGRIRKQLRDDLTENRRHWDLKQKAPDHTVCRTLLGGDTYLLARKTMKLTCPQT